MSKRGIHTILISYSQSVNETTLTDRHLSEIKKSAPGAKIIIIQNAKEWDRHRGNPDVLKTDVAFGKIYGSWIKDLPKLCWIHLTTAGIDRLSTHAPVIKARNLLITNSAGIHAMPISEHVMAMILALSRDIQRSIRRQIRRQWINRDHWEHIAELNATTLGIIGLGRIGQMVAQKAKAFNMEVLGTRHSPTGPVPFVDKIYGPEGLNDLLASSDWVVVAVPLTPATEGMIGESELKTMKNSAYLINIARGKIIQEKALIRALQKGWIAGAGLDVFEEEPLPENSPLWDMENVVITPHHAGVSPHHMKRRFGIFIENLKRYQNGEALLNTVDMDLGY